MKTFSPKAHQIQRRWHVIDAKDEILGRVSSKAAKLLMGKTKPYFAPHMDCGDYVVVINASQVAVTGTKLKNKTYYRHSTYPGGLKSETLKEKLAKKPEEVVELSVKGMLPKNKLRDKRLRRLKVFEADQHPYSDKLAKQTK